MDRESQCLVPVDFESRAFGFPYYRVVRFDERQLCTELAAVADKRPVAADSKVSADDVVTSHGLMRLGFRKVCMQITLRHDLTALPEPQCSEVRIADQFRLDEETIWAHARNFTRDRYSLDPLLPATGRQRLYYQWFRNSFGGTKRVAHIGSDVCTFSQDGKDVIIDLVSILEQRRGNGSRLLTAVLEHARQSGASSVRVKTECENTAAWSLYQRKGFVPATYTSAFHLVLMP
jgi:GNAT superfamily N-acetyltransferase